MTLVDVIRRLAAMNAAAEMRFREQFLYGQREILLAYAAIPPDALLLGRVQHGWDLWFEGTHSFRAKYGRHAWQWVWQAEAESRAKAAGIPRVTAIGAPWLYLMELERQFGTEANAPTARQTLFIPAHYGFYATRALHQAHAQRIEDRIGAKSTTVLLHGYDFLRPEIRDLYVERGIAIDCAGFPAHPPRDLSPSSNLGNRCNYLPHLMRLLRTHERVATDFMGSHIFYAAICDKPLGYWPLDPKLWTEIVNRHDPANRSLFKRMSDLEAPWRRELSETFGRSESLLATAKKILGIALVRSPEELADALKWRPGLVKPGLTGTLPELQLPLMAN